MYRLGLETRSFREALRVDGETFHPDRSAEGSYRGYLAFSRYADHVPEWEALFPRDDVLLVFTDDLAESPGATLSRVHEFLGLPAQPLAERERINRTRDQRRIQARPWAKSLRKAVPDASAQSLKRVPGLHALWSRASRPQAPEPPPITESDRAWLDRSLERHIRFYHERR